MTTQPPAPPAPVPVQLDPDKFGIIPQEDTGDPTQNLGFTLEFAKWVLTTDASMASEISEALKLRVLEFYTNLEVSRYGVISPPTYDDYVTLLDAYNAERGYTEQLRPIPVEEQIRRLTAKVQMLEQSQGSTPSPAESSPPKGGGLLDKAKEKAKKVLDLSPPGAHSASQTSKTPPPPASPPDPSTEPQPSRPPGKHF